MFQIIMHLSKNFICRKEQKNFICCVCSIFTEIKSHLIKL